MLMNIVLIAPHQDDEILSSCLYLKKMKSQGNNVSVVFVTNGDYISPKVAGIRARESLLALSLLGVDEKDVYFMGYADTGYSQATSFLFNLYSSKPNCSFKSNNSDRTYHPLDGGKTVHRMLYGGDASYSKRSFMKDLHGILNNLQPDVLLVPSCKDFHYDHRALNFFIRDILEKSKIKVLVYSYLVHSGYDYVWPDRESLFFSRPLGLSQKLWNARLVYSYFTEDVEFKKQVILLFASQKPKLFGGYLLSFAKREEFYLLE